MGFQVFWELEVRVVAEKEVPEKLGEDD